MIPWLTGERDAGIARLNEEVARGIEKAGESNPEVQSMRQLLVELELQRDRERALPYARAAVAAPLPNDALMHQRATVEVERILDKLAVSFADAPEVLVEILLGALKSGHTGDQVWRALGEGLHGRYRSGHGVRDLRLAAICVLRSGEAINAIGVGIVNEWIGKDSLADGLRASEFLVDAGSVWHYKEATPEDPAWRRGGFEVSGWPTGHGKFGYGDGDETTLLGFGDDPDNKPRSACFRLELAVEETYQRSLVAAIALDDGAIVFIDGVEVFRGLLPAGDLTPDTFATGTKNNESLFHGFAIAPKHFPSGDKVVIAVQVHQSPFEAEDLSFAFKLAEPPPKFEDVLDRIPPEELDAFFGKKVVESLAGGPSGGNE